MRLTRPVVTMVAQEDIQIRMGRHELLATDKLVGKSLKEPALSNRAGIQVCAIQRKGRETIHQPGLEFMLAAIEEFAAGR